MISADGNDRDRILLGERWQILERVGSGGTGVVFRARRIQSSAERELGLAVPDMAAKVVPATMSVDELRHLSEFNHQHIVAYRDVGLVADDSVARLSLPYAGPTGYAYIVEDLASESLRDHIGERNGTATNPLSGAEAVVLARHIFAALRYLHEPPRRCVHGDVKPANILRFNSAGRTEWRLTDFGIASRIAEDKTSVNQLGYSPYWRDPSTLQDGATRPASDIYGAALTVHVAAAGERPVDGRISSAVAEPLATMLAQALQPTARLRPTAEEILRRLDDPTPSGSKTRRRTPILADTHSTDDQTEPATIRKRSTSDRPERRRSRRSLAFSFVGAVAIVGAFATFLATQADKPSNGTSTTARSAPSTVPETQVSQSTSGAAAADAPTPTVVTVDGNDLAVVDASTGDTMNRLDRSGGEAIATAPTEALLLLSSADESGFVVRALASKQSAGATRVPYYEGKHSGDVAISDTGSIAMSIDLGRGSEDIVEYRDGRWRPVASTRSDETTPRFAADGSLIWVSDEADDVIYVRPPAATTGLRTPITFSGVQDLAVSPNSEFIAVATRRSGVFEIRTGPISATDTDGFTDLAAPVAVDALAWADDSTLWTWSDDGSQYLITTTSPSTTTRLSNLATERALLLVPSADTLPESRASCPSGLLVAHILVADVAAAQAVVADLDAGGDFAEVAAERSIDLGSRAAGGDLGCLLEGVFVPEFERVALAATPGVPTEPVETEFGRHIILTSPLEPSP